MSDVPTNLMTISAGVANNEVRVNELVAALSQAAVYGVDPDTTTGLTWGYYGPRWGGLTVANGTVTLSNGTNYIVANRTTGVVSTSTATTNWNNTADYLRLFVVTASAGVVTAAADHRAGPYGSSDPRPRGRPISSKSADYTMVLADQEVTILHPSADTTARTFTIPANASVAYPLGTELEIVNQDSAGVISIAITTDTMRLSPGGTTGTRALAANGWAKAKKLTATEWIIKGEGLT